jgi:hypothetical protein
VRTFKFMKTRSWQTCLEIFTSVAKRSEESACGPRKRTSKANSAEKLPLNYVFQLLGNEKIRYQPTGVSRT